MRRMRGGCNLGIDANAFSLSFCEKRKLKGRRSTCCKYGRWVSTFPLGTSACALSISPNSVSCATARAFQNYLGPRDWCRKNGLLSLQLYETRENGLLSRFGFPLSFLSPSFGIIRQPAHRWLRHRESISKLPRPSGLVQGVFSLYSCTKRDSERERPCDAEDFGFRLSFLSPGFRVIRQPAHRWLRHREIIPKLPWPSGLVQNKCHLSLLLCEKGQRKTV